MQLRNGSCKSSSGPVNIFFSHNVEHQSSESRLFYACSRAAPFLPFQQNLILHTDDNAPPSWTRLVQWTMTFPSEPPTNINPLSCCPKLRDFTCGGAINRMGPLSCRFHPPSLDRLILTHDTTLSVTPGSTTNRQNSSRFRIRPSRSRPVAIAGTIFRLC